MNFTEEEVFSFVESGVVRDLAMSFHVIGEKGIWTALNAYEKVMELHPEKRDTAKLRLEHFGWPSMEDMERAAKMGVVISTQPAFTYLRGGPDMVILDADPMTVNPQTIKDITVLGTIRKEELVYNNGLK